MPAETENYLNHPVTIEVEDTNSGSVVTLTSEINQPSYMTGLRDIAQEWCTSVTQTYERRAGIRKRVEEADAREENNQIICEVQIQAQDLREDGILEDLKNRLRNATGRTMGASAGDGMNSGGPGLQGDVETRGA